jgi:hypothetical protein
MRSWSRCQCYECRNCHHPDMLTLFDKAAIGVLRKNGSLWRIIRERLEELLHEC